ncbi:MAG TPA: homoserine kinase [Methylophilaceae bacterium]|nr:homoserine kinase [Methylophilaceae bacterium]
MSVFTTVTTDQLGHWLRNYPLGELLDLQGIASGITNTNYFVTTTTGRYVLTLFEKNSAEELPYFLDLMGYLAERGIPCPRPVFNFDGENLSELNGKPASLVSCLRGQSLETPTAVHCAEVGRVLAEMHLAGRSFPSQMRNPRGGAWRRETALRVMEFLDSQDRAMLRDELAYEAGLALQDLPHGVIHADLFRDNVLFEGDFIGGVIDFYYACNDLLLYDVAIAVNDWCSLEEGDLDEERLCALLQAYHAVRPFTKGEHTAWTGLLRIAALRFWLSRLYDLHFPQAGEIIHAKDPNFFRQILQKRIAHEQVIAGIWVNNHGSNVDTEINK